MCAIHGILCRSKEVMDKMLCEAHHRGPDGYGQWSDEDITLGHNLLSIIDTTENSKQPWFHNDWVLVYNGEIYNYKELGFETKTNTDTEVLIKGLEKEGSSFIKKLDGMFAFAAYNKNTKELILARDSNGAKPLYYGYLNHTFAFSSEIKSLLAIGFKREVNKEAFKHYYKQGYNSGYLTLFKGIQKLVPGEYVKINIRTKRRTSSNLNNIPVKQIPVKNVGKISGEVRERLYQATKQTLMGRREIGLFLSGGIDSTSILYEMTQALDRKPNTFSSRFILRDRKSRLNEDSYLAKKTSAMYGGIHKEILIDEKDYVSTMRDTMLALEEPRQSKSLPVYYNVNKLIKESGITVTLSGDGGDELLCGYKHHRKPDWRTKLKALSSEHKKLQNKELWASIDDQMAYFDSWFPTGGLQGDERNDFMFIESLNTLSEDFLIRNDKLGMGWSLEGRFPMLNKTFRDYIRSVPSAFKVNDDFMLNDWSRHNKPLLKTAYYGRLPHIILKRQKTGWRFPTDEGIIGKASNPAPYNSTLKDYIRHLLMNKEMQEIFEYNPADIDNKYMSTEGWIKGLNKSGKETILPNIGQKSQKQLFTILSFAVWYDVFKMSI